MYFFRAIMLFLLPRSNVQAVVARLLIWEYCVEIHWVLAKSDFRTIITARFWRQFKNITTYLQYSTWRRELSNRCELRHACRHVNTPFPTLSTIQCCLLGSIFSRSSAPMPSAGLIKAAPSCCHRNGLTRPLAPHPVCCTNQTHRRKELSCVSSEHEENRWGCTAHQLTTIMRKEPVRSHQRSSQVPTTNRLVSHEDTQSVLSCPSCGQRGFILRHERAFIIQSCPQVRPCSVNTTCAAWNYTLQSVHTSISVVVLLGGSVNLNHALWLTERDFITGTDTLIS